MKLERQARGQGWGLSVCRVDSKGIEKVRWEAATAVHREMVVIWARVAVEVERSGCI